MDWTLYTDPTFVDSPGNFNTGPLEHENKQNQVSDINNCFLKEIETPDSYG